MIKASEPRLAYKICAAGEWSEAERAGAYAGSAIDQHDGYIHLSTATQAEGTLARFYVGDCDLVLVAVDLKPVAATVKWEPSRGGELFPHLYGELPLSAVRAVTPIPNDPEERAAFAAELKTPT